MEMVSAQVLEMALLDWGLAMMLARASVLGRAWL